MIGYYQSNSRFPYEETLNKTANFFKVSSNNLLSRTIVLNSKVQNITTFALQDKKLTEKEINGLNNFVDFLFHKKIRINERDVMQTLNRTIYFYKIVLEPFPISEYIETQATCFSDFIHSLNMNVEINIESKKNNISSYIFPIYLKEDFLFARYARLENFQDTPQTKYYHDNQLVDSLSRLSIERYSFLVININDLTVTALSASDLPPAKNTIQKWLKSDPDLHSNYKVIKVVPILSKNAFEMISNSNEVLDLKVDYVNTDGHFKDIISYKEIDEIENDSIKSIQIKYNFKNTQKSTRKISQIINKIFNKKENIEKLETTLIDEEGHKQMIDILENSITKKITINLDGDFEKDQEKIFNILKSNL